MKSLFLLVIVSSLALAQDSTTIDPNEMLVALGNSGWESDHTQTDDVDFSVNDSQVVSNSASSSLDKPCEKEDQNTIPYRFFLNLLASHKLDIEQDPSTGIMNIDGGTMIGNCNSMLESRVGKPNKEIPYTFQVAIKESDSCIDGLCEYEVYHVDKSINSRVKKSYSPDFQGYLGCLKDAGVFVDGKIQKEKIAPTDFNHVEKGVNESSSLLFLSHGFKKSKLTGVYSKNQRPGKGCYFFEDIKKDGFSVYSQGDVNKSKLDKLFSKVCSSGDYKIISKHIDDFKEVENLQQTLVQIRNQLLLKDVQKLHEELEATEDLADINTEKFEETIEDFDDLIIQPLKEKLKIAKKLHGAPGSSQKQELLQKLFSDRGQVNKMMSLGPNEFKKEMAKYLDNKSGQLIKYAQSPYLTSNDYLAMVNPKKGSPINDSRWTGGALKLYKIQSTAFKYGRYNDDFWEANYKSKDKYKSESQFVSSNILDQKIASSVAKKSDSINLLSKTAKNPDINYAQNYQRLKSANMSQIDNQIQMIRESMYEHQVKIQSNCAAEKQRRFFINQQACVREAREALEGCVAELKSLTEQKNAVERKYNALSRKHVDARVQAGLETSTNTTRISSNNSYTFAFTPQSPAVNSNQGGVILDQGFKSNLGMTNQAYQQSGYIPSYQGQNFYQRSPFNTNTNMYQPQASFNFGAGRGPSSYYGSQPSYMNPAMQAYSQSPINYYQGQQTQPGGPMSFTFN